MSHTTQQAASDKHVPLYQGHSCGTERTLSEGEAALQQRLSFAVQGSPDTQLLNTELQSSYRLKACVSCASPFQYLGIQPSGRSCLSSVSYIACPPQLPTERRIPRTRQVPPCVRKSFLSSSAWRRTADPGSASPLLKGATGPPTCHAPLPSAQHPPIPV